MKKLAICVAFAFLFLNFLQYTFGYELTVENFKNVITYRNQLIEKIKNNWTFKPVNQKLITVISLDLNSDGKYKDIKILKSSNNIEFDNSAKQAFLNSIDKNDELLRYYSEFTFTSNKEIIYTNCGLSNKEKYNLTKDIFPYDILLSREKKSLKDNIIIVLKVHKNGTVLDKKVISQIDLPEKIQKKLESTNVVPKMDNMISDTYFIIKSFSKYSTDVQILNNEDEVKTYIDTLKWLESCYKEIEEVWLTAQSTTTSSLVGIILDKDGYIKEYKYFGRKNNLLDYILTNINLPKKNATIGFNKHIGLISFNNIPNGRSLETTNPYDIILCEYMNKVERKIKNNWQPSRAKTSASITVHLEIAKDGKLVDYKIIQSSNNSKLNNSAIEAIKKSAPFPEFTRDWFSGDTIPIEFTFDYNVFNI